MMATPHNCYKGVQSLGENLSIPTILLQRIHYKLWREDAQKLILINGHHCMNAGHQRILVKGCTHDGIDWLEVDMPNSITCFICY